MIRALCLAAVGAMVLHGAASAADCAALAGRWVTDRTDGAGLPVASLDIRPGSRWDWFDSSPGGLFHAPYVVQTGDGVAMHGACMAAPSPPGVDIVMGPLPAAAPDRAAEIYVFTPGGVPAHDAIDAAGISYHRQLDPQQ